MLARSIVTTGAGQRLSRPRIAMQRTYAGRAGRNPFCCAVAVMVRRSTERDTVCSLVHDKNIALQLSRFRSLSCWLQAGNGIGIDQGSGPALRPVSCGRVYAHPGWLGVDRMSSIAGPWQHGAIVGATAAILSWTTVPQCRIDFAHPLWPDKAFHRHCVPGRGPSAGHLGKGRRRY